MTAGRVKGLFLDLDGTLADSMPVMRRVYFDFLARLGRAGIPTWIVGPPGVRPSPSGAAGAVERLDELIGLLG